MLYSLILILTIILTIILTLMLTIDNIIDNIIKNVFWISVWKYVIFFQIEISFARNYIIIINTFIFI